MLFPLDQARDVLFFYRDFCGTLPDEAEAYLGLLTAPQGMPVIALILGYNGPIAEGEKVLAPARTFGKPIADLVGPLPYGARQKMLDDPNATHGLQRYWRSAFTEQIPDELIHVLVDGASRFSSPLSAIIFFYMHGAATRVASAETAFAPRRPLWDVDLVGQWASAGESADHITWVKSLWGRMEPTCLARPTSITCRLTTGLRKSVRRLERLRKAAAGERGYDPTNVFRMNANIAP